MHAVVHIASGTVYATGLSRRHARQLAAQIAGTRARRVTP